MQKAIHMRHAGRPRDCQAHAGRSFCGMNNDRVCELHFPGIQIARENDFQVFRRNEALRLHRVARNVQNRFLKVPLVLFKDGLYRSRCG